MKVLNLDSLAKKTRSITLGGKNYEVKEMTVADFITTTEEAKKLAKETDPVVQMNATVEMIQRAVPDVPVEELKKLSLDHLVVVSRFIQGDMDDAAEVTQESDGPKA